MGTTIDASSNKTPVVRTDKVPIGDNSGLPKHYTVQQVQDDAFDGHSTDDLGDTTTNRYTNDIDITRLSTTSGTNTGDQTLSVNDLTDAKTDYPSSAFNIYIGEGAGAAETPSDASDSTALGYHALNSQTLSQSNTAMGSHALAALTIGQFNVAVGDYNLSALISGSDNTAIGSEALNNAINAASSNTAVGSTALVGVTTGNSNTAVGHNAGHTITTGTNNVVVGQGSTTSSATAINQIVIGEGVTGSGDNTVQIGNSSTTDATFGDGTVVLHADGSALTNISAAIARVSSTGIVSPVSMLIPDKQVPIYSTVFETDGGTSSNDLMIDVFTGNTFLGITPIPVKAAEVARFNSTIAGVYNNGASGVGATIVVDMGDLPLLDDNTDEVEDGMYLVVAGQTDNTQNGLYVYTLITGTLTRDTAYDAPAEIVKGSYICVNGQFNAYMSATSVVAVGTDPITFVKPTKTLDTGLTITANSLQIVTLNNTSIITGQANDLKIVPSTNTPGAVPSFGTAHFNIFINTAAYTV